MTIAVCTDAAKVKGERHRHLHSDAVKMSGDAIQIEETEDYWVIPDTGLTTQGVMNGGLKTKEELARTWVLANGIAVSHDHPRDEDEFGVIVDLRRVGGFVDNVRFDDETGNVIGDVYLAKQAQAGLDVDEANIKRNRMLVTAIQAGEEAEVSIGFWSSDEWMPGEHEGVAYDWIQREILFDHLASVPLGACSWGMGCGLGRHQGTETVESRTGDRVGGTRGRMSKQEAEQQARERDAAKQEAKARQDCADRLAAGDGGTATPPTPPAAPAAAAGIPSKDAAALIKRIDALEAERKAEKDALIKERRVKLASLLDSKPEGLPADLSVAALDAWIDRERDLQGLTDPPLNSGDAVGGKPRKGFNFGEEVDGVTLTPHGMTVTDWAAAEQHAAKAAKTGGWTPTTGVKA